MSTEGGTSSTGSEPVSSEFATTPATSAPPSTEPAYASGRAQARRRVGKVRKPWGVWGLSIITLGIYQLYWWYKINEEVREYDERIAVQPGIAVFAAIMPIANIVTIVKTGGRLSQAQRFGGLANRCSGGLGFVLAILFGMHIVYYQGQLNKLWDVHGNQPAGTPI